MDYVTRQFVNLTKKFRKEFRKLLSDLHTALHNQTNAIRESIAADRQRQNILPPIQIIAELHTPEDVERDHNRREDRQYRLQQWLVVGTWLTFLAASIYGGVAYLQWREMDIQNINQSAATINAGITADRALRQSEEVLKRNTEAFHADQRAWVLLDFSNDSISSPIVNHALTASITIDNNGKTPARRIRGAALIEILDNTKVPDFSADDLTGQGKPKKTTHNGTFINGGDILYPNSPVPIHVIGDTVTSGSYIKFPETAYVALHGSISYYDVFEHRHWIHFCIMKPRQIITDLADERKQCVDRNSIDDDIE